MLNSKQHIFDLIDEFQEAVENVSDTLSLDADEFEKPGYFEAKQELDLIKARLLEEISKL